MEKQVKLFLDFLKDDKKLSDNTLQSYRRDIEQYGKYKAKISNEVYKKNIDKKDGKLIVHLF